MERGIVIVGSGECGVRAAFTLRQSGYGGPLNIIGNEVHLPYERPPLSKAVLGKNANPEMRAIAERHLFESEAIRLLSGTTATAINVSGQTLEMSDGRSLPYDQLLLATGSRPRKLPIVSGSKRIFYLRTFDDVLAIEPHLKAGSHIAVLGGGFIGLELAAAARMRDTEVTVIEAQPRILMRAVPTDIASRVHLLHEENGVSIMTSTGLNSMAEQNDRLRINLTNGEHLDVDALIVGIGAQPATELAELAGLEIDNGIAVGARLGTSAPNIWAAGDCCSFPLAVYEGRRVRLEAWRNAQAQGTHVASNMMGADADFSAVPWFWSDQYDWSLQIAGLADGATRTIRRDLGEGAFLLFHLAHDGRLLAASGIGPGNSIAKDIKIAEMLIERRASPSGEALASPTQRLKALLSA